jgi:putative transposase
VQIDHTFVDIQLADERRRAVLGRPWLTLVLDVHTRSVLGLYVPLAPPSAVSVALAISLAVLPRSSPKVRRLLAERTGGVTLSLSKAIERAAIAAIQTGKE